MQIADFLNIVLTSTQQRHFFHFTDNRNLASIKQHGLLPTKTLRERALTISACGGNEWSLEQDVARGMDTYVHLCFRKSHPMEHIARGEGRIADVTYLRINPQVINFPGALITLDVSNKAGIYPGEVSSQLDQMDLAVLYTRANWKDPAVLERLKAAEKYELLIPNGIPVSHIVNI